MCGCDGRDSDVRFRVIREGLLWSDYLLPEEREKYDKLSENDPLFVTMIAMSCDPINALKDWKNDNL